MIKRFTRTLTHDGTWIVADPVTGLSKSAAYLLDAVAELKAQITAHGAGHAHAREARAINVSKPTTLAGWKHL